MNKDLKIENFWLAIIWIVIFMLILSWDQEKIVVLNLIIFCYFLYYLIGDSIQGALGQRKSVLLDSLLIDLNTQIDLLNILVEETRIVLNSYNNLILTVIKKTVVVTNNLLLSRNLVSDIFKLEFTSVQAALQSVSIQIMSKELQQNLFITSQSIADVSPSFISESPDSE